MKLNLFHIFSELVTGIAFISIVLIYGYLSKSFDIATFENFIKTDSIKTDYSFLKLLGVSILIYYIGFIIDGIGLGMGELFLDNLLYRKNPSNNNRKKFFREVSEHVLEYRSKQWAYYSCYRNFFLLTFPLLIIVFYYSFKIKGIWFNLLALIIVLIIEVFIVKTLQMLLRLYYSIEESFQ